MEPKSGLYNPSRLFRKEDYTGDIRIQIHPTHRFYHHLHVLRSALDDVDAFDSALGNALKTIERSRWDTPFQPHGAFGHDFSYPINHEFLLVFKRQTDRDAHGAPLKVHLFLKTIELIKT